MSFRLSFTRFEHDVLPAYREKMNRAGALRDVEDLFLQTTWALFEQVYGDELGLEEDDLRFFPAEDPCYGLSPQLKNRNAFLVVWCNSDLPRIVERLAEIAQGRYRRLSRRRRRSDSKIRIVP